MLVAGRALGRGPVGFDRAILVGLRAWDGPGWLHDAAIDLTALGSGIVLTIAVGTAAGLLVVRRRPRTAVTTILACWGGGRVVDVVKWHVARPRPEIVAHWMPVTDPSFPSAHAASSAICYLTLALLAGQATRDPATQRYITIAAIVLVAAIGASRVYLGVHWPSDVLAGWTFGGLWALGWWRIRLAPIAIGGER